MITMDRLLGHLTTRDLVAIALFACIAKVSGLVIALAGGGMNPLALVLRNAVVTGLLIVMLAKVAGKGVLFLNAVLGGIVSLVLFGHGMMLLPGAIIGSIAGEGAMVIATKYGVRAHLPLVGAACSEISAKLISLCVTYVVLRENPVLLTPVLFVLGIGCVGTFLGLWGGWRMARELRRANII